MAKKNNRVRENSSWKVAVSTERERGMSKQRHVLKMKWSMHSDAIKGRVRSRL